MRGDGRVVRREIKHVIEPDIFEPTSEVRAAIELARMNGRVRELEWNKESHEGSLERMSEDRDRFGEKCARLEERVRELEALSAERKRDGDIYCLQLDDLEQQLKTMTEDRDRYYRKWKVAAEHINSQDAGVYLRNRNAKLESRVVELEEQRGDLNEWRDRWALVPSHGEIISLLRPASSDENYMALAFVRQLMNEGREEHGELELATDDRTVEQLMAEAVDEGIDSIFYLLAAKAKIERGIG
jgi:DNA repair exonuclease SbcCD ATPase subunit